VTLYKKRSQAMQISLRKTYFSQCVSDMLRTEIFFRFSPPFYYNDPTHETPMRDLLERT
jgi:hypothetical protein